MGILTELKWRGLIHDISDEQAIDQLSPGTAFYVGFDPTAPSLQLGNLVPLIGAMHLAKAGLKPVILFGGATGRIGDPSGKNKERVLLEEEQVVENTIFQTKQAIAIFDRIGVKAEFVDNYEWTRDVHLLDFMRDYGKHFPVNYMLAKEVVKTRLDGGGISFTEFAYMLLQAFDYHYLYENKACRLQVGGSDQWGNITAGLELIRRKSGGQAHAFSFPLITDSSGKKFGKSEQGALWLDASRTSPYRLHQFLLNSEDADVPKLLRIFTFISQEEILELEKQLESAPEKRAAQNALADAVVDLVHGKQATQDARKSAQVLFGGSLEGLTESSLEEIFADVPSSNFEQSKISESLVLDLMVECTLVKSKGEARRLIQNGGAYLNNQRVTDVNSKLSDFGALERKVIVLRSGKKQYHLVRVINA